MDFHHGFSRFLIRDGTQELITLPPNIHWMVVKSENKFNDLLNLLERINQPALIFVNTREEVDILTNQLKSEMLPVAGCHHHSLRDTLINQIKKLSENKIETLVCTYEVGEILRNGTLSLSGADFPHPNLVVQYVFPLKLSYIFEEGQMAGKNGHPAYSALFFQRKDRDDIEFRLEAVYPPLTAFSYVIKILRQKWHKNALPTGAGTLVIPWDSFIPPKYASVSECFCESILSFLKYYRFLDTFTIERLNKRVRIRLRPGQMDPIIYAKIERMKSEAFLYLDEVEEYIFAPTCRIYSLLNILGKAVPEPHCGHCDLCTIREKEWRLKKYDQTFVQSILMCVAEVREKFGRSTIIDVAMGKNSRNVRQFRLTAAPSYGSLKGRDRKQLNAVIHSLIGDGFLSLRRGLYPTLELTHWGRQVLEGKEIREIQLPKLIDKLRPEEYHIDLFELLRTVRSRLAKKFNLPTFQIFPDRVLQEMAIKLPANLAELGSISGIGKTKLEEFGTYFLTAIIRYKEQNIFSQDNQSGGQFNAKR